MNARLYDSDIGRFLSADTIIQAPKDSQAYNRYTYVRNNPMMFTDPSGHSWFSKAWKKIVGIVAIVVGVVVASLGLPTIGASIAGAGVSLYNYDKTGKFEIIAPIVTLGDGGSKGKSPTEQDEQIDTIKETEVEREKTAGLQNPLGASSDNVKFAGGVNTSMTVYTQDETGITLAPIVVYSTTPFPKGYEWIGDLPEYAYEGFTYTNIGGVIDVLYQYDNGEIGGYYAAGLLGATALGGKAGGKVFGYLGHKAPLQTTHGVRQLDGTHITSNGRAEPWIAYYDKYGRQIARTDYTTGIHGTHHHTREYLIYPDNVKVTDHIKGEYIK